MPTKFSLTTGRHYEHGHPARERAVIRTRLLGTPSKRKSGATVMRVRAHN
jgi:hypothetical protein